jgi:xanthine dehydrogenase accessory factor
MLADAGHDDAALRRVQTPIGLPEVAGKDPATLAVSVAASLYASWDRERAGARETSA